jgi:uncharacterized small protein (DUF1192 family)
MGQNGGETLNRATETEATDEQHMLAGVHQLDRTIGLLQSAMGG